MSSSSAAMAAAGAPHSSPPDPSPTKPKRRFFFPPCRSHSLIGPPPPPPTPSRLDPNLHHRPAPCRPAPTELPAAVKPLFTLFLESEKPPIPPSDDSIQIHEVWASNLDAEFELIRDIVENFPYVAMDTEFPGIVIRPVGNFKTSSDFNYATLKANVDLLKLIQLGLTFSDEDGNLPDCGTGRGGCVWQFNFREFNPENDCFANDSIQLLRQSGINFDRNTDDGVDARRFGELLMSSGVVLNCAVHWVTFHSGYDFGYLLKQVPSLWVSAHVDCDLKLQPSHCFLLSCYGPIPLLR